MDKFSRQTREVDYILVRLNRSYYNTSGPDRDGDNTTGKCGGARQESCRSGGLRGQHDDQGDGGLSCSAGEECYQLQA